MQKYYNAPACTTCPQSPALACSCIPVPQAPDLVPVSTGVDSWTLVPAGALETITDITNTIVGHLIGIYTNEAGDTFDISETITNLGTPTLTGNVLSIPFTDENGDTNVRTVDLTGLAIDAVATFTYDPITGNLVITEANGDINTVDVGPAIVTQVVTTGNIIATFGNVGSTVDILETVTSISGNVYTNELGLPEDIVQSTALTLDGNGDLISTVNGVASTPIDLGSVLDIDDQTLSVSGDELTISGGNTITLPTDALTNTITGHIIGTHTAVDGSVVDIEETVTDITDNGDGTSTFTFEDSTTKVFNTAVASIVDNLDGTFTFSNGKGSNVTLNVCSLINASSCAATAVDNLDGTYTITGNDGVPVTIPGLDCEAVQDCIGGMLDNIGFTYNDANGVFDAGGTIGQVLTSDGTGNATWEDIVGGALVNHTPIAFVPAATGNTTNLNEIVTDPDGNVWYIDGNGDAVMVECNQGFKIDTSNLTTQSPSITSSYVIVSALFQGIFDDVSNNNVVCNPISDFLFTYSYSGFPDVLTDMPLGVSATVTEMSVYVKSVLGTLSLVTMDALLNGVVIGTVTVNQTPGTITSIALSQTITPTDVITFNIYTPDTDSSSDFIDGIISLKYT